MITPRTTRLVRVANLRAFRDVLVSLACGGTPFDIRNRLVVVPTHAAAAHLVRSIENRVPTGEGAMVLPELITQRELTTALADRLAMGRCVLTDAEREALLGVACRAASEGGAPPPFRLRPALVAEILRFYDTLRGNGKDVATFERLALGALEPGSPPREVSAVGWQPGWQPGAAIDRGAERLARQTRFLVSAFRHFERLSAASGGIDEHMLRSEVIERAANRPWRHAILAVGDRSRDPHGLTLVDWDVLSRVPGLERIDVVVTNSQLAGSFHERIHQRLPGIEEAPVESGVGAAPVLLVPPGGALVHLARDREEEVAGFSRWVKQSVRSGEVADVERVALVVRQPLPYVYLAREVMRSAGIPCQMFDTLPLAAEPYAAALDLVFSFVSSNFARIPAIALLRSPHFRFPDLRIPHPEPGPPPRVLCAVGWQSRIPAEDIAALDRALGEAGYLGDHDALVRVVDGWRCADRGLPAPACRAGEALAQLARELQPLRSPAPLHDHLTRLLSFLTGYESLPELPRASRDSRESSGPDDPLRARQLRARSAILATLVSLRDAYRRFDAAPVDFDEVAAMVRRWIEGQTFSPRTGDTGVHLVDAESAKFGDFDHVQLAGLVEGEWPDHPRRNIFYSPGILRDLGWTAESERIEGARAAFADLLTSASSRVLVSGFTLEDDAMVAPATVLDEVEAARLDAVEWQAELTRIFEHEALGLEPVTPHALAPVPRDAALYRLQAPVATDPRYRGTTEGHAATALSLGALERYQDCPFKFFAADVLRLEEAPEDESAISPRARGRFVHEVFQRFFEAWDRRGDGTFTSDRLDDARELFEEVAAPLLAQLPEAEAGLERARLFGSAIAVGIVDVVLGIEASRPTRVLERWLERRFEGEFALGASDGRRIALKGVADRIDLLEGDRLRVIDYKSGYPPDVKRALQVPIYALCAQEALLERDDRRWSIDEAAYVAFSGKRSLVPVIKAGAADPAAVLGAAHDRLVNVLDGVAAGVFPPRPHEPRMCGYCAYPSVCRKDYVGDD
ncbi:MAG TPA: PD-(D/E)XK nuclease family protein [Vicinamibacterales bacterium]